MILADRIRQYVISEMVAPARAAGKRQITVRAGDVHQAVELEDRMPAVCGALDAVKFYDEAEVILEKRTGPPQGANVEWVLGL